jgi:AraC family transcriptional regulator of adaptative response/methylated-DNA-[protein]-cysteine methyltransferase
MIEYQLGTCSLGCVLVAMSEKGICFISMGDSADELEMMLKQKYPHAQISEKNADLQQNLLKVLNYVEQPKSKLDIELDIVGTAFQKQVWSALTNVPPGQVSSYSEIAKQIGLPLASRAVAAACAANSLALAIPCHRIIKKDGGISGYRWGVARKKILLQKEGAL